MLQDPRIACLLTLRFAYRDYCNDRQSAKLHLQVSLALLMSQPGHTVQALHQPHFLIVHLVKVFAKYPLLDSSLQQLCSDFLFRTHPLRFQRTYSSSYQLKP